MLGTGPTEILAQNQSKVSRSHEYMDPSRAFAGPQQKSALKPADDKMIPMVVLLDSGKQLLPDVSACDCPDAGTTNRISTAQS